MKFSGRRAGGAVDHLDQRAHGCRCLKRDDRVWLIEHRRHRGPVHRDSHQAAKRLRQSDDFVREAIGEDIEPRLRELLNLPKK